MEFRLIYEGALPAASQTATRASDKHRMRRVFHEQLKHLWKVQQPLSRWCNQVVAASNSPTGNQITVLQSIAHQHSLDGYHFAPIVTQGLSLSCELDILFLRRDEPGKIMTGRDGGDVDNRLKVLFDALRKPKVSQEINGVPPGLDEDPFFVLLEDDSLIRKITVTTDRLLTAHAHENNKNNVHLVIAVNVRPVSVSRHLSNLEFLG